MTANGLLQIAAFLLILLAVVKPPGWYMARVYQGEMGYRLAVEHA